MKVTISKILETIPRTSKAGKVYELYTFTGNDDKLYKEVYSYEKLTEGQEIEGEWKKDDYGKDKFEVSKKGGFGGKGGFSKSDPTSFHVSYAKDMVVAFINQGIIKDEKEAMKQWTNFATGAKALYDKLSKGENPAKTPVEPPQIQTVVSASNDEPPMPTDNEIDISEVNFE
jgi:hypothetical protein